MERRKRNIEWKNEKPILKRRMRRIGNRMKNGEKHKKQILKRRKRTKE